MSVLAMGGHIFLIVEKQKKEKTEHMTHMFKELKGVKEFTCQTLPNIHTNSHVQTHGFLLGHKQWLEHAGEVFSNSMGNESHSDLFAYFKNNMWCHEHHLLTLSRT